MAKPAGSRTWNRPIGAKPLQNEPPQPAMRSKLRYGAVPIGELRRAATMPIRAPMLATLYKARIASRPRIREAVRRAEARGSSLNLKGRQADWR
jgi:hypothetical protein